MSHIEDTKPRLQRFRIKRVLWGLAFILGLVLVTIMALRFYVKTDSGRRFIENRVNQTHFGLIEDIQISGLTGDVLSEFSIEVISVGDREGVWLEAQEVSLAWTPWALLKRDVVIDSLRVGGGSIKRKPVLNTPEAPQDLKAKSSNAFKFSLGGYEINRLSLDDPVIGQNLTLQSQGAFVADANGALDVKLEAERLDAIGETFGLTLSRTKDGNLSGHFDVDGAANGPIANLLRAPTDRSVTGSGYVKGNLGAGQGEFRLIMGDTEIVTSKTDWTQENLRSVSQLQLGWLEDDALPIFSTLKSRLGPQINARIDIDRKVKPQFLNLDLEAKDITLNARANMDGEFDSFSSLFGQAEIDIKGKNIARLFFMSELYDIGSAHVTGTARLRSPLQFDGDIKLVDIKTPYVTLGSLTAPVKIEQNSNALDLFNLETQAGASGVKVNRDIPIELHPNVTLETALAFNRTTQQIKIQDLVLGSGDNRLAAKGLISLDGILVDVTGQSQAQIKLSNFDDLKGASRTQFTIKKTANTSFQIIADGDFETKDTLPVPLGDVFGKSITFKTDIKANSREAQSLIIEAADLRSENFRLALSGGINNGRIDISGEALLPFGVTMDNVIVSEGSAASLLISGTVENPNLKLDAKAERISLNGFAFETPQLRLDIDDALKAPSGPVQFNAQTEQGPLGFGAQLSRMGESYAAKDIDLIWGHVFGKGDLSISDSRLITGELDLSLDSNKTANADQFARATLTLIPQSNVQALSLEATAKNFAYNNLQLDEFTAKGEGSFDKLSLDISAKGQSGDGLFRQAFEASLPIFFEKGELDDYKAFFNPQLQYGKINLTSRSPVTAELQAGGIIEIVAPLSVSGSDLDINYLKSQTEEQVKLKALSLPVRLLPLPAILEDTRGDISVDLDVSYQDGATVLGRTSLVLTDWRGTGVKKGEGLDLASDIIIEGQQVSVDLTSKSLSGFSATGKTMLPLSFGDGISDIRVVQDAAFNGELNASGPAQALLGLISPEDTDLKGNISANIDFGGRVNAPTIVGQVNGQDIAYEIPNAGTQLRQGRFKANFTQESLSVSDVYFADDKDGFVEGGGDFTLGAFGRPIGAIKVTAKDFTVLDRRDIFSNAAGNINFENTAEKSKITGDVTLLNTVVKEFTSGGAAIIEIEVEERNAPKLTKRAEVKAPLIPIDLDLNVKAPRRIYIRSRGLDIELEADANIKGTVSEPLIYGEANIIRGGYRLAGKTLELQKGQLVFNGPISETVIDFEAVTNTQDIDAKITITGTATAPELALTSRPERPEDEILSALLFGRSVTAITPQEAAQLAGALAQISGKGGGFDLLGGLRDTLGVEQLNVSVNDDGALQLTGGRYLAKNVYFQIFSGVGPEQTGAVIDWEIRKNLALSSRIRADNDQSFSLKWKKDF